MVVHTQGWNAEMADGWLLSTDALIVTPNSRIDQASVEATFELDCWLRFKLTRLWDGKTAKYRCFQSRRVVISR